jgi:hypothetical protein
MFGTSKPLDVKVKANLHWHARAIPPSGADYAGEWPEAFPLITTWPKVTIASPLDGQPVYPWPVKLRWHDVKGAAKYKVELTRKKDQWGVESQSKPLDFTPPTTKVDLNLKPRPYADNEKHTWRVRVWGPPPLEEEGQNSGWYTFVNNGDKTIPELVDRAQSPGSTGPDGIHWMQPNGITSLAWKKVKNAKVYWLQLMNFGDDTTDPDGLAWADKIDALMASLQRS